MAKNTNYILTIVELKLYNMSILIGDSYLLIRVFRNSKKMANDIFEHFTAHKKCEQYIRVIANSK